MQNTFHSATFRSARRTVRGFSLVEVTLAVAVVAIGVVGILALFPLGMDAVRKAADDTQMMAIGEDIIGYFQQEAAPSNHYSIRNIPMPPTPPGVTLATEVISNACSYSVDTNMDGIYYHVDVTVTNAGFPQIFSPNPTNYYAQAGPTNMTTRIQIAVYRAATNLISRKGSIISNTVHYYFTEVDRYVQ